MTLELQHGGTLCIGTSFNFHVSVGCYFAGNGDDSTYTLALYYVRYLIHVHIFMEKRSRNNAIAAAICAWDFNSSIEKKIKALMH